MINKYFNAIFFAMLGASLVLAFMSASQLESRLEKIDAQLDYMYMMLDEMSEGYHE